MISAFTHVRSRNWSNDSKGKTPGKLQGDWKCLIIWSHKNERDRTISLWLLIGEFHNAQCIFVDFIVVVFFSATKIHDDVIKWKHFPRNWPFVRGIHRSRWIPCTKGQWRGALMFSLICARINDWINNREAGDLRRYRGHYDVTVMCCYVLLAIQIGKLV